MKDRTTTFMPLPAPLPSRGEIFQSSTLEFRRPRATRRGPVEFNDAVALSIGNAIIDRLDRHNKKPEQRQGLLTPVKFVIGLTHEPLPWGRSHPSDQRRERSITLNPEDLHHDVNQQYALALTGHYESLTGNPLSERATTRLLKGVDRLGLPPIVTVQS